MLINAFRYWGADSSDVQVRCRAARNGLSIDPGLGLPFMDAHEVLCTSIFELFEGLYTCHPTAPYIILSADHPGWRRIGFSVQFSQDSEEYLWFTVPMHLVAKEWGGARVASLVSPRERARTATLIQKHKRDVNDWGAFTRLLVGPVLKDDEA